MKLDQILLTDFRNIENMSLFPDEGINVIYGDNAQGKTNLIEAIWLFTGNQSFRGAKTSELIRFNKEGCKLKILFSDSKRQQEAELFFGIKKKILLNHVDLKSSGELNGNFYAVVFSPAHLSLVREGPKFRRRFLDIAISQIRPQYEGYLSLYERLLEQRNALLKNYAGSPLLEENIEVWDIQLAKAGTILSIYRSDYVKKLRRLAGEIYGGLSSKRENFDIYYQSTVFENLNDIKTYTDETVGQYIKILRDNFLNDVRMSSTSVGIHRDDLEILIDEKPARAFGSQGQQRSSVIALKLAEASLLKKATGENPVILLDDVMSELDVSRQSYILNHLKDMQVFITCCNNSDAVHLEKGRIFHIENGVLSEEKVI